MFIDIHCHLDMLEKDGADLDEAVENARKKDVRLILAHSINGKSIRKNLDYAKRYPEVRVAAGIYPINALKLSDEEIDEEIEFIRKHKDKVIAIGEVGMDFKEDTENKERQEMIFEKFILLSMELDVPVVVHSRKAEEKCIEVLERLKAEKVIMHCFSGKLKLVDKILENGWYLTIPTCVKHAEHFQKVIEKASIGRLFCETDSPYMHPDKEFPNEPGNVIESYQKIAEMKGLALAEAEEAIEKNFKEFFR